MVSLLVRHQLRAGHHVGVASLYDPMGSWIEAQLRASGAELFFLGKRPGLDVRMIPRVARVLKRFAPDLLHTHMQVLHYALPARACRRCLVVHTMHTGAARDAPDWPTRLLQRLAFRTCVVPVAIGRGVAESIREVYGFEPRHVIPNGIPVAEYAAAADPAEVRASLALPAAAPLFVCVGQLWPVKNHAGLLRAFASDRLAAAGAHLLLVGDGALRGELERQAEALGVAGRVRFLGVRTDVPRLLSAADVFVLASSMEGNPLSVMEAMAAGRPVIATAVGCVPELVTDGAGALVPPGDESALEAAMYAFASDPGAARAAGAEAARVALERFDASRMATAYDRLYSEITA